MKTKIEDGYGTLMLGSMHSGNNVSTYRFPLESLPDWYPFNIYYYYYYNFYEDEIILGKRKNYYNGFPIKGTYLNVLRWYNEGVHEDNLRISQNAHIIGLKSIFDTYTEADVHDGFKRIGDYIDAFTMSLINKYASNIESRGRSDAYNQERYALDHCTHEEDLKYTALGEIYQMYNMMRKVRTVNELI